jgi:uncharacterized protein
MLAFLAAGFDWDEGNLAKCQKHGLAVDDIEAVFKGALQVAADEKHSTAETRYYVIGRGDGVRPILVVFTLRRQGEAVLIRPISARYMHRKETHRHENQED